MHVKQIIKTLSIALPLIIQAVIKQQIFLLAIIERGEGGKWNGMEVLIRK